MSVEYNGKKYVATESLILDLLGIKSIKDIKGLNELTSLKELYLNDNLINEIAGLDNLKNLETLSLQKNNIKEIQGLENLINLKNIDLSGNPVFDWVINKFGKKYKKNAHLLVEYCYKKLDIVINKEDYELVRKVLKFEFANQRQIKKVEMADELNFSISEIAKYDRIINQNISYNKGDELELKNYVDEVIKLFSTPSLYDFIISLNLNYEKAVKLGQYLIKEGWIKHFPNFPIRDDYEDWKLVKSVLKFEYDNQRKANKVDMLHELDFNIDEIRNYFKIIDQRRIYMQHKAFFLQKEILKKEELEKFAEQVIKQFPSPTLYDLLISFKFNYEKAIKLGDYLIEEGFIKDFPDYPVKEPESVPKKDLKPKKVVAPKKKIVGVIAAAGTAGFSEAEKKELEKTESEMDIKKKKVECIVHRGPIVGSIYLCPNCMTYYCIKCAKALKEKDEACWSCGEKIEIAVSESEIKQRIKDYETRLDSLKITVKNLDESFFTGAISKEEYIKMKDSLTEKIGVLLREIKNYKS